MTVNWSRGTAGDGVIVLMKAASAVTGTPADGTYSTYTANTAFGTGTLISDGYVVFKGAGTSVTVTGLVAGTTYHVAVFEYKGTVDTAGADQGTNYLMTPAAGSQAATAAVAPTLTTPTATAIGSTTATLGATVTNNGGTTLTARGTCWDVTASPLANCVAEGGTTVAAFTQARTGLTSGAKLYYRGYATNSAGTGYSSDGSFYTEPSSQASAVTFPAAGLTSMTINWARGTGGDGVLVLVKSGAAVDVNPVDGSYTGYTANAAFASGTQIGTGNYVVYKGTGTSVTVTGLVSGTTYHVAVYEYKGAVDTSGADQGTNYLLTPATGNQTTLAPPTDAKIVYSSGTTTPQNRTYTRSSNTFGTAAAMQTGAGQTFVVTKASAKRNEYISGYVTTGGVLYIQRWNGLAWSAEWNVTVGGNGVNGRRFDIIYENLSGDAMVVYSTDVNGSTGNEMAYRIWNGTAWSAATTFASARLNQAAAVTWIKLASRPGSDEIALLAEDEGTTTANTSILTSLIWSGSAWGNEPAGAHATNMYNSTTPAVQNDCIDLAYESLSGDLLVVWTSATPQQYYRTYSGGTWAGATSLGTGRAAPLQMALSPNPNSDQILFMFNRSGSANVYGNIWSGTGMGALTTVGLNGGATATNKKTIAGGWLNVGGTDYAIALWQTNVASPGQGTIGYNRFSGTAWGTAATYNTGVDSMLQWMDIDVDPFSPDRFLLTYSNGNGDLFAKRAIFNGTGFTWSNADGGTALSTALASITSQNFDFAYSGYTTGPTLSISQPDGTGDTIAKDATYTVTYSLSDPDDAVTAALYYDSNSDGTGGTAIAGCGAVAEGAGATCAWNTTGVAPGTYYVYGVANDGVNPAVTKVSNGVVTINAPPTLSIGQPDGVGDSTPASSLYNITYSLADSDDTVTTAFYYDTNTDMTGGVAITGCSAAAEGTGVTCSWDTAGMTAGDYYVYGVTSGDALNPQVKAVSPGVITITAPPPSQDDKLVYSISTTTPQFREYTNSSNSFNAAAATVAGAAQTFFVTKSSATRDEYISGYVTTGGVLYIRRWNGTAWSAEWNVTVGGNGVDGRRFDIIYENLSGDAMVVYSTNATGTAGNEMAYRVWNGATWTAAANISSARLNQNATVSWVKLAARPGSDQIALLASDSGTTTANTALLTSLIWSGTAWGNEPAAAHNGGLTPAGIPNTTGQLVQNDCFDLAYESLSGDLLVVFSTYAATPAGQQWYRTYSSAGTWGTSTSYGTARTVPQQMIARSNPNTDQILVAFNRSASANVYGNVWTGTGVGTTTTVGANGVTTANNKKHLGGGWLNVGGTDYAVVIWQTNTATPNQGTIGYNRFSGAAWGTAATYNTGVDSALQWLDVDTDPFNSDRLMLTYSNAASDLYAKRLVISAGPTFTWSNADGGAALTAALASITSQNFDFAYARRINCVETGTVAIDALPGTISAPTAITATAGGGATVPQVRWNENGGTWSAWQNSGATYTPAGCTNGTLNVEARAAGTCAQITATPATTTYNTQDADLAVLDVVNPVGDISSIYTVKVAVAGEGTPADMTAVLLDITGISGCNVSNAFMSWNSGSGYWEYSWDSSACGTAVGGTDVTIAVQGTDPDCNNTVTKSEVHHVDNSCSDTTSTVNWTVPGATVTAPLAITATGSTGVTDIEVSFDDGTTWLANGSTYTPKVDTQGTSTFRLRALDTCGKRIYGGSSYTSTSPGAAYVVTFDGRLNRIRPLEIIAEAAGKTSIRVQMNYCSDKNDNAQTTLRYKLTSAPDLPANWITIGPVVDGADADGLRNQTVLFMLTGLTTDTSYDLELTVAETAPDVVDWTTIQGDQPTAPPWKATVQLSSWLDSPLMHNALRFACSKIGYANQTDCVAAGGTWNLDRKWPGGWGLPNATYPNAQYESFECGTCHVKNSSNVKRVITAVTPKADGPFPGSAVSLQDVREGTAEFGDDSDDHTTSTRACEVCHSQTTYHRQDTTGQTNKLHNNKTDCIRCHEHNVGFRASCDSCHGTPPVDTTGLATDPAPTGSTVWGEHQKHAVDIGYDCKTCHNGWDGTDQMPSKPTAGNINIGFKPSVNPQFAGATRQIFGGTYEGRTTGGGYTGDNSTTPVTTVNTATGAMTCAVYCHGYGRPVWNPTSSQPCGSCHGKVNSGVGYQSGAPTGVNGSKDLAGLTTGLQVGKHAVHLDDSAFQTGDPCALCHSGYSYTNTTHVDGTVNVLLRQEARIASPGTAGGAGINAYYDAATGSCKNMECHGDTPWNSTAVLNCTQSCHNYPPVGVTAGLSIYPTTTPVNHDTRADGGAYLKANHKGCLYCHGWNDNGSGALPITGATAEQITVFGGDPAEAPNFTTYSNPANLVGQHMDGKITMNDDGDGNTANDADYDPTTGGCDNAVCHPNDATHRLNISGGANIEVQADIGPGDCAECHATGVGGATVVKIASTGSSPHTDADGPNGTTYTVNVASPTAKCTNCHSGHYTKPGGVKIPNNPAVGINYLGTQHGGINIGGPGTVASITAKTTEAETCWGCHDTVDTDAATAGIQPVSEWGINSKMTGSPVATQYNYGTLSTSDWTAATWSSGKGATFAYKTGAIQSTHAANSIEAGATSALTGTTYAYKETKDDKSLIRCSYCHDVHDAGGVGVGPTGKPYLRGTWWSNPYEEDGAPQAGQVFENILEYGAVPRGGQTTANMAKRLGGFWIDANNVRPGTASTTVNGTPYANPTITGGTGTSGAWTLSDSAGLCVMCHTNNVNTMDQQTGEALWFGTNGHANSAIGGTGTASTYAANIFELRGSAGTTSITINPPMHFKGTQLPGDSGTSTSYRNGTTSTRNYTPSINAANSESTRPFQVELWGAAMSYDNTTTNSQYHKFSCSKCHNPHASRLPKLMITNCLDTKHNTWDDSYQLNTDSTTSINYNRSLSNWSTAQNCHRVGGIIPATRIIPATGGTYPEPVDAGAVAAPAGTGTDYQNRGWNTVTPW